MSDFNTQLQTDGIRIYALENHGSLYQTHSRKDLYKISLLSGTGVVHYRDRSIRINGSILLIAKPGSVCTWNLTSHKPFYTCVITREFLKLRCFDWLNQCGLFASDEPRVHNLSIEESRFLRSIFQKMIDAQNSEYPFKGELIQDQICVLLHMAFSITPSKDFVDYKSVLLAASRIVELIEMQFPPEAQLLHFN